MALSAKQRRQLVAAVADNQIGNEIADVINSGGDAPAAFVAAIGVTSNLVGVDGTGSNAAPLAGTESRLDALEAKVDAILAALKAASLMLAS